VIANDAPVRRVVGNRLHAGVDTPHSYTKGNEMNTITINDKYQQQYTARVQRLHDLWKWHGKTLSIVARNVTGSRLECSAFVTPAFAGGVRFPIFSMHKRDHKLFYAIVAKLRDVLAALTAPAAQPIASDTTDWCALPLDAEPSSASRTAQSPNGVLWVNPNGSLISFGLDGRWLGGENISKPATTPAAAVGVQAQMAAIANKAKVKSEVTAEDNYCLTCRAVRSGLTRNAVWTCVVCSQQVDCNTGKNIPPFAINEPAVYLEATVEYVSRVMSISNSKVTVNSARGAI
jgi:hypothetical protein